MGTVFLARHTELDRKAALKVVPADASDAQQLPERFRREAESACRLNHPNIVKLFDFGQAGDWLYLAMEFVEGQTLQELLRASGSLPAERTAKITRDLLAALQVCHDAGMLHRDIKPANVMIDREGTTKLLDLGLVKRVDRTVLTEEGLRLGTPRYMPPEMVEDAVVDHRADIYQIGMVTYECLAGHPPFQANGLMALLAEIVKSPTPPLPELEGSWAGPLARFAMQALSKRPADRPSSCREADAELTRDERVSRIKALTHASRTDHLRGRDTVATGRPPSAQEPSQPQASGSRPPSASSSTSSSASPARAPWPAAAAAFGGAIVVLVALMWFVWSRQRPAVDHPAPSPSSVATPVGPASPSPLPGASRPATAPAVRALVDALDAISRMRLLQDFKRDYYKHLFSKKRDRLVSTWRDRVGAVFGDPTFERAARDYLAVRDGVADDLDTSPALRARLIKRLDDLAELKSILTEGLGTDLGVCPDGLTGPGIRVEPCPDRTSRTVLTLEFGDGGRADGRRPLPDGPGLTRVPGTARFHSKYSDVALGALGVDTRVSCEVPFKLAGPVPRRLFLGFRMAGGRKLTRLAVSVGTAEKSATILAMIPGGGSKVVREGCVRIDPRPLVFAGATLFVFCEDSALTQLGGGIVLDHLLFYGDDGR